MTPLERRSSLSLALLFMCRMLGLFLLMPVFAVAAHALPGGDDPARVGLALGMYGLTQACMQIPLGLVSDRWGRRPVVVAGLLLFTVGSVVCAMASGLTWITAGRAIQGAGAISAAVTAWLADATRDEVRTKAMALIGASIGFTFALSLVLAPVLLGWGGLSGLFWTMALLGVASLAVAAWLVPTAPVHERPQGTRLSSVLIHGDLLRLNAGVFCLHLVQVALFVVIPPAFARLGGLDAAALWKVYLPIVVVSFVVMVPIVGLTERFRAHRRALLGGIAGLVAVCLGLIAAQASFAWLIVAMVVFFSVFNVLEAMQPSLVSRVAPPSLKGLALGCYNTSQAIGLFCGGAVGGWLASHLGPTAVFEAAAALAAIWLAIAWGMRPLPGRRSA